MANNLGVNTYTVGGMFDTWGAAFVQDLAIFNKFAGDTYAISNTSGTVTLDVTACQNFAFRADGGTASQVDIRVPDGISRWWMVENARASGAITVRCAAGGTSVTLNPGERRMVRSDGTNCTDLVLTTVSIASVVGLQAALDLKATIASPTFTGTPAAPTAGPGTNTTQIATTAFVTAAISAILNGVSSAFDTLSEIATDLGLKMVKTANLSDVANAATARSNLGVPYATAGEFQGNTASRVLETSGVWNAAAEVTLTDAATIAVDMATFFNAKVTLGGNRTLGNPTNPKVGQSGYIRIIQDGTGSRTLAYGSNWKFANSITPSVSTAAAAEDVLFYYVISSTRIYASLAKAVP